MKLPTIIQRWTKREKLALHQQFHAKKMSDRFRGLRRSKRNEARLFLTALLPPILTVPLTGKWSDASVVGKSIMVASGFWMIGVLIVGGVLILRALSRVSSERSD